MKKNIFVELVYQEAHANRPSEDFVVLRADVIAYMPAAVNFALTKGFYTQKNNEDNGDIPSQFYQYFSGLSLVSDAARQGRYYFTLPRTLVALPSDRALRSVLDNCDNPYMPIKDSQMSSIKYWEKWLPTEHFYRQEGKKVYLYNKPNLIEFMNIIAIVSADELGDEDELSLPSGSEAEAITMCADLVLGRRNLVDRKSDARNLN